MMRSVAIGLMLAALCCGQEGTAVFISRCIQCHDPNSESHAPLPEALGNLPWQDILKTLETGSMKAIGAQLSAADKIGRGALPGQSRSGRAAGDEGLLRGWREAQSRRFILEWLGRGREEHAVSAGEGGGPDRGAGSQRCN